MDARRRHQHGDPGDELVGREDEEERPASRTLHPVDEPAVLALREPLDGERWAQEVSAQSLETFAVVAVDPDARVEREAAV